ncbi:hypothetical protein LV28_06325 [Pandoraea pnomenusa]|nr:hypothetical protein LV28_06325 [Pandoraea pnomenusa]
MIRLEESGTVVDVAWGGICRDDVPRRQRDRRKGSLKGTREITRPSGIDGPRRAESFGRIFIATRVSGSHVEYRRAIGALTRRIVDRPVNGVWLSRSCRSRATYDFGM